MTPSYSAEALDSLTQAHTPESRQALIRKTPELAQPATVRALYDRVAHYLRIDLSKAEETALSSLWLANCIDDPQSIALSLRALGNVLLLQNQPQAALSKYSEALRLFTATKDDGQAAQTHLNILSAFIRLGDYSAAHKTAFKAKSLLVKLDDTLGLARLDNNLASLLFRQENYLEARRHWKAALATFQSLGQNHDAAIALRNLAVCEISLDNFHAALDIYNDVTAYCKQHKLTLLLHEIDYNIAYLFFLRGNHERALEGYRLARARSLELGDSYHAALCDLDEAELYLELNLLSDSLVLAQRATSAFEKLGKSYEAAKALAFQAIATARQGDDHRALELLRVARAAFSAPGHLAWESLALLYQALVLLREGRRFEAQRACKEALAGFVQLGNPGKSVLCHVLLGRLALGANDPDTAHDSAENALSLLSDEHLPQVLFQVHLLLGDIADHTGDTQQALGSFYAAERLLQQLRTQLSSTDLHIPFPHSRLVVYDRLLRLETLISSPERLPAVAFGLIEKAKARTLSDLLGSRAATIPPISPTRSGLVEQVRSLREELQWYYKTLSQRELRSARTQPTSAFPKDLQKMEQKIVESLTELASEDRQFGHLHDIFSIELQQIQVLLEGDEAILEYFVGEDVISLVVISKTNCSLLPVAVTQDVRELTRQLEFQLSRVLHEPERSRSRQQDLRLEQDCLNRLRVELLEPASSQLKGISTLRVIPHGFLSYLPFHALVATTDSSRKSYHVSYSPDVTSLFFCKRREDIPGAQSTLLVTPRDGLLGPERRLLSPPWTGQEVSEKLSLRSWRRLLSRPWGIISLPLSVQLRFDNPVLSSVSLCGTNLNLLDIFQIELNANLVVLTDCGLIPPRKAAGDEVLFLSRSVLYSGPRAVLMPLWRGRVAATERFLDSIYSSLSSGLPPQQAVERGQRVCRQTFPSIADWAPFVLFGV